MANRWAVASGNWSSAATWNGGTLPAAVDDVYSNGFVVQINTSVTANTIRNVVGTGILAGGWFEIGGTADRTLTVTAGIRANVCATVNSQIQLLAMTATAGTITIMLGTVAGGGEYIIGGDVAGKKCIRFFPGANCHLIIETGYGYVGGGDGGSDTNGIDMSDFANGNLDRSPTITINGGVRGGAAGSAGIYFQNSPSTALITVNGTVYGGGAQGSTGIRIGVATPKIIVNAQYISGGSAYSSCGIYDQGPYNSARRIEITVNSDPQYGGGGYLEAGSNEQAYAVYLVDGVVRARGMHYSPSGTPPLGGGGNAQVMLMRGAGTEMDLPTDDYWPDPHGAPITLAEHAACPDCVSPLELAGTAVS